MSLIVLLTPLFWHTSNAQNAEEQAFTTSGKPFAKVFWNFHYDMTQDVNQTSAFQLQ